jgi:hypothetical protein
MGALASATAIVAIVLLLFPIPLVACSQVFSEPDLEMKRDFTLVVSYEGKPLIGVQVDIYALHPDRQRFTARTAADGTIRVKNLQPGNYWAVLDFAGISESMVFKIVATQSREAKARLDWAWGRSPVAVRQAAGRLFDTRSRPGNSPLENQVNPLVVPLQNMPVELRHPIRGTLYSGRTDERGEFTIAGVPEGTFVLSVPGLSPNFLIQVRSDATRDSLLFVNPNLCGGALYLRE